MLTFLIFLAVVATITVILKGSGVPVFLYHQVNDKSNINKSMFEDHLEYIHSSDLHTFTISEARSYAQSGGKLPPKSLLITFDDGYYDNYLHVFPLLKRYQIKATFFINTMFIKEKADRSETQIMKSDDANREAVNNFYKSGDGTTDQYMTWEEIREMQASGLCDFQAHTHSHKMAVSELKLKKILGAGPYDRESIQLFEGKAEEGTPVFYFRGETTVNKFRISEKFLLDFKDYYHTQLKGFSSAEQLFKASKFIKSYKDEIGMAEGLMETEERIRLEIKKNKQTIEEKLKNEVFAFAWPYGHKGRFTKEYIRKEGISAFVTCKKGTNTRTMNFDLVRRIELRKPTLRNFKWAVNINLNLLTGKIYELFT